MPTVTATQALNMADPFDWNGFYDAFAVGPTSPTSWWAENFGNTHRWQIVGTGFGGYQQNIPNSGNITSINIFTGANPSAQITGLSVTIPTFFTYLALEPGPFLNLVFAGNDTINGSAFNDFLTGYGGVDTMNGGGGDDSFLSVGTHDIMDGGTGTDSLQLDRSGSSASFSFSTDAMGTNTGVTFADGTVVRNFERFQITSGSGNDAFIFTASAMATGGVPNWFHGGAGSDRIESDLSALIGPITLTETLLTTSQWSLSISSIEQYTLSTGSGDDLLNGGALTDIFNGGDGDDRLIGRGGANTLNGGGGNDTIEATGVGEVLDGGADFDTLFLDRASATGAMVLLAHEMAGAGSTLSDGTIVRGFERFNVTTGAGDDMLQLVGLSGSNSFHAGGGVDTIQLDLSGATDTIHMSANAQQIANYAFTMSMSGVDRFLIAGGVANDTLYGLDRDDWLHGGGGNDVIHAGAGNNTIYGAENNDTITAGAGNDTIYGGDGNDNITGGGGLDTIDGGEGVDIVSINRSGSAATNYTTSALTSAAGINFGDGSTIQNTEIFRVTAGAGDDTLTVDSDLAHHYVYWDLYSVFDAGDGNDVFTANFSTSSEQIRTATNAFSIWDAQVIQIYNFERMEIWGGSNNDLFYGGTAGDDYVNGGSGNDLIRDSAGNDTLIGGEGNDEIWSGEGVDTIDGGEGVDRIRVDHSSSTANHVLHAAALLSGYTFDNGTQISGFEVWDIRLGSGDDTFVMTELPPASIYDMRQFSFDAGAGFDIFQADLSASTSAFNLNGGWSQGYANQVSLSGFERFVVYTGSGFDQLTGGDGDDIFSGGGYGDNLNGAGGNDLLIGGAGDDSLTGREGVDVAVYNIASTAATWTRIVTWGDLSVNAGAEGVDSLDGVEVLRFTDRDVWLRPASNNITVDSRSDILFQHDNGLVVFWSMNGATIDWSGAIATAGPEWTMVGAGDFNADGRVELLWQNTDGLLYSWRVAGPYFSDAAFLSQSAGVDWEILAIGDFSRDYREDIVWQRGDGSIVLWEMDLRTVTAEHEILTLGAEWSLGGVGDFNGDGRDDFIWRRDDGLTLIWQMDGANIAGAQVTSAQAGNEWQIVGVGDINGDAYADLIWQRDDGLVVTWQMQNGTVASSGILAHVDPNEWTIMSTGDYNGDLRTDILWQNEYTGTVFVWLLNGNSIASAGAAATIGPEWEIIGG